MVRMSMKMKMMTGNIVRRAFAALLALACCSTLAAQAAQTASSAQDPSTAKARKLVEEMIAAMGGQAYLSYTNYTQAGRTSSFYQGQPRDMSLLFARTWQWPDKERLRVAVTEESAWNAISAVEIGIPTDIQNKNFISYIYNGPKGYEISEKGTADVDAKTLEDYLRRRAHSPEAVLRQWWPDPRTVVLYSGSAILDQHLVQQVTFLNSANDSVTFSIDNDSRLLVGRSFTYRDEFGYKVLDTERYSNFKRIDGIMTPFSIIRKHDDWMVNQRFISGAHYNQPVEAKLFEAHTTYDPSVYTPKNKKK